MQHFDVAVIGSGSGNSIIDERFSHLKVALIERDPVFGGTCLNRGCIPTKMFTVTADHVLGIKHNPLTGVEGEVTAIEWPTIRDRIFGRIDPISSAGQQWRQSNENITLFQADASFVDAHTLQVGEEQITADQIVIATGSRPRPAGLEVDEELRDRIHTSDTIMRLEELPEQGSLLIVGGGYVAVEFAHIFASLGLEVTIVNRSERLLRGADEEVAAAFATELSRRVRIRLNQTVSVVEKGPAGELQVVTLDRNGVEYVYLADLVLVATGRIRNSDTLNLAAAGIDVRPDGQIKVDAEQRTNQPHVFALGDVSSNHMLKHVANAEARTVQHNLLASRDEAMRTDERYVPSAVFSHPQLAQVGATEEQLREWGMPYVTSRHRYADVAYGWALEDEGAHFVKLLADPRTWHLLGAHIMGPQAATLIQPLIQAMSFGLKVPDMARGQFWIHPALTEVVENALLGLMTAHEPAALEVAVNETFDADA